MPLLKAKIFQLALDAGIPSSAIDVDADSYVCPEPLWITNQFGVELCRFLDTNGIDYRDGQFICRNFALLAVAMADLTWYKTQPRDDALAFGMVGFIDLGHKLNFAVHRRSDASLYIAFYESQKQVDERGQIRCLVEKKMTPENLRYCRAFQLL